MSDVTRILSQIESGDPSAAEQLVPLVYDELRKLAAAKLAQEKPGQTLQATALVHEAYLRLVGVGEASTGTAAAISSLPRPRPCGGFWWRTPAAKHSAQARWRTRSASRLDESTIAAPERRVSTCWRWMKHSNSSQRPIARSRGTGQTAILRRADGRTSGRGTWDICPQGGPPYGPMPEPGCSSRTGRFGVDAGKSRWQRFFWRKPRLATAALSIESPEVPVP